MNLYLMIIMDVSFIVVAYFMWNFVVPIFFKFDSDENETLSKKTSKAIDFLEKYKIFELIIIIFALYMKLYLIADFIQKNESIIEKINLLLVADIIALIIYFSFKKQEDES
ncbi:MAG TPA: hypothetical protein GX497_03515 [Bacillus bacterium]|nr:hypothetical protein [Bacillus sp. (in: firmicutes)]